MLMDSVICVLSKHFIDFKNFVSYLRSHSNWLKPTRKPVQIAAFLYNMYKKVEGGYLLVEAPTRVLVTTNKPDYRVGRKAKQRIIYTRHTVLHECLSRTEADLRLKLKNWGHNTEVNSEFLNKWLSVDQKNYKEKENFFYIEPEKWRHLIFVKGNSIKELQENLLKKGDILPSSIYVFFKNMGQFFKFLFK